MKNRRYKKKSINRQPFEKKSSSLIIFLALLISLGPLSSDLYLSALPLVIEEFNASIATGQLMVSVFILGLALGQLLYGPLSDLYGRKPVLIAGLILYVVMSLACVFVNSADILIYIRFFQAIGACAAIVLGRTIVRDIYQASAAARVLSFMSAFMGLVPAIVSVTGGIITTYLGWRAHFIIMYLIGVGLMIATYTHLPETLNLENRRPGGWRIFREDAKKILFNKIYTIHVATSTFSFAGLFFFISSCSFILQIHYHVGPIVFGFCFLSMVMGYVFGGLVGAWMSRYYSINKVSQCGAFFLSVSGVFMALLVYFFSKELWHILIPILFYGFGCGLVMPQAMAGALTPFPKRAGLAASLLGTVQLGITAILSMGIGAFIELTPFSMALSIAIAGTLCFICSLALPSDMHLQKQKIKIA